MHEPTKGQQDAQLRKLLADFRYRSLQAFRGLRGLSPHHIDALAEYLLPHIAVTVPIYLWKLDDDGYIHYMAAIDEETARREGIQVYSIGEEAENLDDVTCEHVPDAEPFTVTFGDGLEGPYPKEATIDGLKVTAPAAVWAEFCGNGVYLAGSDC